jgi:hypothetical protein
MVKTSPSLTPLGRTNVERVLTVALVLCAILIGFVALQSVSGVHGFTALTAPTSHTHPDGTDAHAPVASAPHAAGVESNAAAHNLACDQQCALDCALMAMMCVMLLVITALIVLTKYPAVHHRLLEAGQRAVQAAAAARQHVYFPSLTVLSISRT